MAYLQGDNNKHFGTTIIKSDVPVIVYAAWDSRSDFRPDGFIKTSDMMELWDTQRNVPIEVWYREYPAGDVRITISGESEGREAGAANFFVERLCAPANFGKDHCEHVPSDAANDFVIGSPASWFTNNNDIRSGAQHQTSRFHQNVAVTAEAYRLRFEWQYNLGYCSQLNKGQGKSPSFKLLIGGAVQWQWQVDLSAGGEYPHDTRCGGAPQAYSPVQLVEVDLLGVTGDKLTWEIVSNDRNMHVNFVHMELCSRGGVRGYTRTETAHVGAGGCTYPYVDGVWPAEVQAISDPPTCAAKCSEMYNCGGFNINGGKCQLCVDRDVKANVNGITAYLKSGYAHNYPDVIQVQSAFSRVNGLFQMVGHKHGFPRYTGPNGATLSFERQAVNSDWAAAHWLQSDVWTILEGGHHRFALRSPGGSKPPTQSGWEARTDVGAQLPIDLWTPVAQDYTFLFNACPRGSGIPYNNAVNGGAVTRAVCEAKCNADPACRVIEMAGCSAGGCVGQCMLYRGSEGGEIRNGGCTTDGSMKSFLKPTSISKFARYGSAHVGKNGCAYPGGSWSADLQAIGDPAQCALRCLARSDCGGFNINHGKCQLCTTSDIKPLVNNNNLRAYVRTGQEVHTGAFEYLWADCPRGDAAATATKISDSLTRAQCMALCEASPSCNGMEVTGCLGNPADCGGQCYHFSGVSDGSLRDGNCGHGGDSNALWKLPAYTFLFTGCPRGVGAATWKQIGSSLTKADCMRRCDADIHCNAIEILGCRDNPQCLGDCYHFYGTSDGAIHNECTNDLAQYPGSAYRKLQGGSRCQWSLQAGKACGNTIGPLGKLTETQCAVAIVKNPQCDSNIMAWEPSTQTCRCVPKGGVCGASDNANWNLYTRRCGDTILMETFGSGFCRFDNYQVQNIGHFTEQQCKDKCKVMPTCIASDISSLSGNTWKCQLYTGSGTNFRLQSGDAKCFKKRFSSMTALGNKGSGRCVVSGGAQIGWISNDATDDYCTQSCDASIDCVAAETRPGGSGQQQCHLWRGAATSVTSTSQQGTTCWKKERNCIKAGTIVSKYQRGKCCQSFQQKGMRWVCT
uniref:Uncharacterized protein n=1 Tax=Eutreptiella gymnastica TaxID=73025 RepID=A0A7S4FPY1_9EUGL